MDRQGNDIEAASVSSGRREVLCRIYTLVLSPGIRLVSMSTAASSPRDQASNGPSNNYLRTRALIMVSIRNLRRHGVDESMLRGCIPHRGEAAQPETSISLSTSRREAAFACLLATTKLTVGKQSSLHNNAT